MTDQDLYDTAERIAKRSQSKGVPFDEIMFSIINLAYTYGDHQVKNEVKSLLHFYAK